MPLFLELGARKNGQKHQKTLFLSLFIGIFAINRCFVQKDPPDPPNPLFFILLSWEKVTFGGSRGPQC
jgi:hypothetical protein